MEMIDKMDGVIALGMLKQVKAMIAALGSGFTVKGVEATVSDLPASGELGDIYLISTKGYTPYTWDDTAEEWKALSYNVATAEDLVAALYS